MNIHLFAMTFICGITVTMSWHTEGRVLHDRVTDIPHKYRDTVIGIRMYTCPLKFRGMPLNADLISLKIPRLPQLMDDSWYIVMVTYP